jgi:hypothetical protein
VPVEVRQAERVSKYTKFWHKDSKDDSDVHKQSRLDSYTDVVNGASGLWLALRWRDQGC